MENFASKERTKPTVVCPDGAECQRKIPHHFMEYSHEHLDKIIEQNSTAHRLQQYQIPDDFLAQKDLILDQIKIIDGLFHKQLQGEPNAKRVKMNQAAVQPTTMDQKLAASRPYNYFLTRVQSSPQTHNEPLSVTFQDLFDPSLGDLESSVQINYVVDSGWLLKQYISAGHLDKPLLVLYDNQISLEAPSLEEMSGDLWSQLTPHMVQMEAEFGNHHTKMMLLGYKDGSMRVVVSTANLCKPDWHDRTQGLWISDKLGAMPSGCDSSAGESETGFRNELDRYLSAYARPPPQLAPWIQRIKKTNFKSVKVFLVTSVPGTHRDTNGRGHLHGHGRVRRLLAKHSTSRIDESTPIVAQCSSIGKYGASINEWLTTDIVNSFRRHSLTIGLNETPSIRIIYPSLKNVQNCYMGVLGADCVSYQRDFHQGQLWLNDYLYQWRADCRHRSQAVPHIKTYCRWSEKKLFWFMLTSANLSKAAWGKLNLNAANRPSLHIDSYEAGVLFLPKFVTNTDYFSMDDSDRITPTFPSLYDIPLTRYAADDQPFLDVDLGAVALPALLPAIQNCNQM